MTADEADVILRMIEDNWSFDLKTARPMWREELMNHDAELTVHAVARLARTRLRTNRPGLNDIVELLRLMTPAISPAHDERRFGIPSWVYVWKWARNFRDPKLDPGIALPQQKKGYDELDAALMEEGHSPGPPPDRYMSEEEYDDLHAEWVAVGSPRVNPASF